MPSSGAQLTSFGQSLSGQLLWFKTKWCDAKLYDGAMQIDVDSCGRDGLRTLPDPADDHNPRLTYHLQKEKAA